MGQAGDAPISVTLLDDVRSGVRDTADKARDADGIRALVRDHGAWSNIPPRSTRKASFSFSRGAYRQRNLVERLSNRIKQMRRIATRYDRGPTTSSQPSSCSQRASRPTPYGSAL
ncbi:transposase [Ancylobacter sonchi]|nr:transposase [Ancylobacter sonchi]